jgi:hypothetical protein
MRGVPPDERFWDYSFPKSEIAGQAFSSLHDDGPATFEAREPGDDGDGGGNGI